MAHNSYGLINDNIWIGIPKVATSTLYALFNVEGIDRKYFNENTDVLQREKDKQLRDIWCIWRHPWKRWVSAILQDYEIKLHMGTVNNGVKVQRDLEQKDLDYIISDLNLHWSFGYNNIKNHRYPHSNIQLARYIFLLWKLSQERFLVPNITICDVSQMDRAVEKYASVKFKKINFNKTNKSNLEKLDQTLKSSVFYSKWCEQYKEDLILHNIVNGNICKLHEIQWINTITASHSTRHYTFYKRLARTFT